MSSPVPASTAARRGLYPEIQPYRSGYLRVSPIHELYFEECGNPRGKPAIFAHGGPGAGGDATPRRFFDPANYRIILFDQRGCGRSRPHAELNENTTRDLVADMERLREELGIDRWLVFGGSWGSTLALVYGETHPERVTEIVLRGIFLLRPAELAWFYQHGASEIFPDRWEEYLRPIPLEERGDLLRAYHRRLTGDDPVVAQATARAWSIWEGATSHLFESEKTVARFGADEFSLALARIEAHYFVNGGFLDAPDQILRDVGRIRKIPGVIVQGRYDVVCPMVSAWDLHRAWPEADFRLVPDAGHSAFEPGITHELISATDRFSRS
jgi:proline iminopeptidase